MLMSCLCNNADLSSVLVRDLVSDLFDEREREGVLLLRQPRTDLVSDSFDDPPLSNPCNCIRSHISRVCVCACVSVPWEGRPSPRFWSNRWVTVGNKCYSVLLDLLFLNYEGFESRGSGFWGSGFRGRQDGFCITDFMKMGRTRLIPITYHQ